MSDEDMNALLVDLPELPVWQAILKYWQYRDGVIFDALRSVDPFKNPTEIARNQGVRLGLYDLKEYIAVLRKDRDEANSMVEEPAPALPRKKK